MSSSLSERIETDSPQPVDAPVVRALDSILPDQPRTTLRLIDGAPVSRPAPKADDDSEAVVVLDMFAGGDFDHFIKGPAH